MTVWIPIVFTLLFALSACCVIMLAASMRALMPPTIPDISTIGPTPESYLTPQTAYRPLQGTPQSQLSGRGTLQSELASYQYQSEQTNRL